MEEEMIEVMGMRLANRAYLYRIFHIVFGAEPSGEELDVLSSEATLDAFRYLSEVEQSSQMHFETDASSDVPATPAAETLASTYELLASFKEKKDDSDYIESLHSEFTRLFLVPGSSYVYPWESPYIGKEVMLFQESTLDVRHRYRDYGYAAVEFGHFPEDHLSMMLDFLAYLSNRAFDAFENEKDDEVKQILTSQEDFIASHFLNWLPKFYESLCEKEKMGVYRQFTEALQVFLELDSRFIEESLT